MKHIGQGMEICGGCFKPTSVRGHDDSCIIPLNLSFLKGCCSQTYLIIPHKISIWLEAECTSTNGPNPGLFSTAAWYLRLLPMRRRAQLKVHPGPQAMRLGQLQTAHIHTGMTGSYSEEFANLMWLPGHNLAASGKQDSWNKIMFLLPSLKLMPALETEA